MSKESSAASEKRRDFKEVQAIFEIITEKAQGKKQVAQGKEKLIQGKDPQLHTGITQPDVSQPAVLSGARNQESQQVRPIMERAVRYIRSDFGKSSGKVAQVLRADGYPENEIQACVEELIARGYIDHDRAVRRVNQRHQGKNLKAKRYMRQLYQEAGLPATVITEALAALPDDEETIQTLIEAKYPHPEDFSDKEYQRALGTLLRRGYSYGLIHRYLSGPKRPS